MKTHAKESWQQIELVACIPQQPSIHIQLVMETIPFELICIRRTMPWLVPLDLS